MRNEATTSYVYRRLSFRLQREVSMRLNLRRCGWEGGSRGYGDGVWSSTMRSSLCDTAFATNLRYWSLPAEARRSREPLSTVPAPVDLTPPRRSLCVLPKTFHEHPKPGPVCPLPPTNRHRSAWRRTHCRYYAVSTSDTGRDVRGYGELTKGLRYTDRNFANRDKMKVSRHITTDKGQRGGKEVYKSTCPIQSLT